MSAVAVTSIKPQKFLNAGNDARRKNDLKELQNALQSYYTDRKEFPCIGVACSVEASGGIDAVTALKPTYISTLPLDPKNGTSCPSYVYAVDLTKTGYTLFAKLEDDTDSSALAAKPPPTVTLVCALSADSKTCTMSVGQACPETVYNYWVNNP